MPKFSLRTCVLILSVLTTRMVFSTTYTWVGGAGADWSTAGNWSPTGLPTSGDTALFTSSATPSLSADVAINTISIPNDPSTLTISGAHTITFDNRGSILTNTSGGVTINTFVALQAGTFDSLTINQTVPNVILIPGSGTTFISGGNSGASPSTITYNGVGTSSTEALRFSGAASNTYTGTTIVNSGWLNLNKANATAIRGDLQILGSGTVDVDSTFGAAGSQFSTSSNVIVNTTGFFSIESGVGGQTISSLAVYAGAAGAVNTMTLSGLGTKLTMGGNTTTLSSFTLSGASNGNDIVYDATNAGLAILQADILDFGGTGRTLNIGHNDSNTVDMEIDMFIQNDGGHGLTKTGAGVLQLTVGNTYTGPTNINAGTLSISSDANLGTSPTLNLAEGTTLQANGASSLSSTAITLSATPTGANFDSNGSTLSILSPAAISGTGSLNKIGAGTLTLGGTNNYSAATNINTGTLALSGTGSIATSSSVAASGTFDISGISSSSASITDLSGSGFVTLGSKNLTLTNPTSTFSGGITGTGGLTKTGSTTFRLTGTSANTYSGVTSVNVGTLQAGAANAFSASSDHTLAGTLDLNNFSQAVGSLAGAGAVTLGSGTLTTGSTSSTSFSGGITGTGGLTKTGSTTFTLAGAGANTYSGATSVSAGTLQASLANTFASTSDHSVASGATLDLNSNNQTIGSLAGAGSVTLGSATLTTGSTLSTTFSGNISGSGGSLTKLGNTNFILTGTNTYTGVTTVSAGTLQGNTSSLPGDVINNASVVFDQSTTGTYGGAMTGSGSLTKQNAGNLSLSGTSSFGGSTSVSAGRLSVNGPLTTSGVTVASGATLGGTGTINAPVTANGTLSPGNSIGTLNIVGNVVQGDNSTLQSEVDPTTSSLLNITGNYTIGSNATLFVTVDPGVYPASKSYNLVTTTSGTVSGQFATVTLSLPLFRAQVLYEPNDVVFTEISSVPFSEVVIGGNAGAVATCLDTLTAASGSDLELALAELRMIPTVEELYTALALLQPSQYTALALAEENATLYANGTIFERLRQVTQVCPEACKKIAKQPPSQPALAKKSKQISPPTQETPATEKHLGFWLSPFGALSRQHNQGGQTGFNAGTGGIATGWDFHPSCHWTVGGALGYSYVHLKWREGQGHSNMNNGYGALYASAAGQHAYLFGSMMGSYNQYDTARHIDIDSDVLMLINRTAKGEHKGWQGSGHLQGGLLFGKKIQFSPFIEADYIYVHENGFNEHGAKSLDLHVAKKNSDLLQAEGGLEISRCFAASTNSVSPSVGFSVIREWRFIGKNYTSNFIGSSCVMQTSGMKPTRTLYSPAAGLTLLLPDENRTLSFEYKGKFGEQFQDNRLLAQFVVKF